MRILLVICCLLLPMQPLADALEESSPGYNIDTVAINNLSPVWLVQDDSLPIVNVHLAFKYSGAIADPDDKFGLAYLASRLLDQGAGSMNHLQLKTRLQELAVTMYIYIDNDNFHIVLRCMKEHLDSALAMLNIMLLQPHFDQEDIDRVREETHTLIAKKKSNVSYLSRYYWKQYAFGNHRYGSPHYGSEESLKRITRNDLQQFAKDNFAQNNMRLSIVGDIRPGSVVQLIHRHFSELPIARTDALSIAKAPSNGVGRVYHIPHPTPQSVACFGLDGVDALDADYYAATVLNYILGGGSFQSRLMEDIREERGLAYSVYTYLSPNEFGPKLAGSVSSRNSNIGLSIERVRAIMADMQTGNITQDELDAAKRYLIGSFTTKLDSNRALANYLIMLQLRDYEPDFLGRRNKVISQVTLEDIQRVAKRLLNPNDLLVVVVGGDQE